MIRKIIHYGLSQALPKIIGIVSLPYITKLLSVGDYGLLSLWLLVGVFSDMIVSLNVERSYYRLSASNRNAEELEHAILQIVIVWGLLLTCFVTGMAAILIPDQVHFVLLVQINGLVTSLINFYRIKLQVENRSLRYAKIGLVQASLTYALIILSITFLSEAVKAYLIGILVANSVVFLAIFKDLHIGNLFDKNARSKEILVYSGPLLVSSILIQSGLLIDRELIALNLTPQDLGEYSVLVTLGTLITLTASVIRKVIDSEVYVNFIKGAKGITRNYNLFQLQFLASALVASLVLLFKDYIAGSLYSNDYLSILPISGVYFIGILLNVLEGQLNIFFHRFKSMGLMLKSNVITLSVKALTGFLLIHFYGIDGILIGVLLFPLIGGINKLIFLKRLMQLSNHLRYLAPQLIITSMVLLGSCFLKRTLLVFITISLATYLLFSLKRSLSD